MAIKNNTLKEICQSFPWGPWSSCINATCQRMGMIYRWRQFPTYAVKFECKHYPFINQVDTCWPPPNMHCTVDQLQSACFEHAPALKQLCLKPMNGTKR